MAFDPKTLPTRVYNAFELGPLAWPLVIEEAIKEQMTDVNELTDIVFYLHHPDRIGDPLGQDDVGLISEWKAFRRLIKARVSYTPKFVSKDQRGLPFLYSALTKNE